MIKISRKYISILLAAAMAFSALPMSGFAVYALNGAETASDAANTPMTVDEHAEPQTGDEASVTIDGVESFYSTLAEAWSAVQGKTATVTLLADAEITESLNIDRSDTNITFQGGDFTLSVTDDCVFYVEYGKLTIESGTILANSKYNTSYGVWGSSYASVDIQGGTIRASGRTESFGGNGVYLGYGSSNVTISEGVEIYGEYRGIYMLEGTCIIKGGTISSDMGTLYVTSSSTLQISGGTLNGGSDYIIRDRAENISRLLLNHGSTTDETHYAFYSGETPMEVPSGEYIKGDTITVKECTHMGAFTANNDGTHSLNCQYCGYTEAAEACTYGSEYIADETNHTQTCTACGGTKTEEHTSTVAATCKDKAVCDTCGKEYGDFAGHTLEKTEAADPTCTEDGNSEYWTCSVCEKMFSDENGTAEIDKIPTISALGHQEEEIPAVPATCTTTGKTAGVECSVCQTVLTAPENISALGHDYSKEWSSDSSNHWYECSRCDSKNSLAPHTEDSGTVTVRPTAEAVGKRVFACTECKAVIREEEIPVLDPDHSHEYSADWKFNSDSHWHECICGENNDLTAHTWNEGETLTAPTCTEAGSAKYTCTVCNMAKTEIIEATGHQWNSGTETQAATCTENGTTTYTCTACGDTKTENIAALGHNFVGGTCTRCGEIQPNHTHTGGTATCTKKAECAICGNEYGDFAAHNYINGVCVICNANDPNYTPTVTEPTVKEPTVTEPTVTYPNIPSGTSPSYQPTAVNQSTDTSQKMIDMINTTADGGTAEITLNGATKVDKTVFEAMQGRDITVVFKLSGGAYWTINGRDITKAKTVDLGVRLNKNAVPASKIKELAGDKKTVQFTLKHSGDFGFTGILNVPFSKAYNGKFANLYYYSKGEFEFVSVSEISGGNGAFMFTHASDYVAVIDDYSYIEDVSSAAGATDSGSPIDAASPVTNGVRIPQADIPRGFRISNKKRRYRILKKL